MQDRIVMYDILQGGCYDKKYEIIKRVTDISGISPTLNTCGGGDRQVKVCDKYRIRRLTPQEYWRLMGMTDEDFFKCVNARVSNSQLYKQAGNSIVVQVLEHIFTNLFKQ